MKNCKIDHCFYWHLPIKRGKISVTTATLQQHNSNDKRITQCERCFFSLLFVLLANDLPFAPHLLIPTCRPPLPVSVGSTAGEGLAQQRSWAPAGAWRDCGVRDDTAKQDVGERVVSLSLVTRIDCRWGEEARGAGYHSMPWQRRWWSRRWRCGNLPSSGVTAPWPEGDATPCLSQPQT